MKCVNVNSITIIFKPFIETKTCFINLKYFIQCKYFYLDIFMGFNSGLVYAHIYLLMWSIYFYVCKCYSPYTYVFVLSYIYYCMSNYI